MLQVLIFAAIGGLASNVDANIVQNSGFEQLGEDGEKLEAWGLPQLEGAEFGWDEDVKHSGERSGRIRGTDADQQSRYVQAWRQNVGPLPEGPLLFTMWAKAEELDNGDVRALHKIEGGEVVRNQSLVGFDGTFDWRQFSAVIEPEPNVVSLQLVIGLRKSEGVVWFDDVELAALASIGESFGILEMTPTEPQRARETVPVRFTVTMGERGLSEGGQVQIRGDHWRMAREFRLSDCSAWADAEDARFAVSKPPKKETWPPSGRELACDAKLVSGGPLEAGSTVTIEGMLTYTPHSNVSVGIIGRIKPGANAATFPLENEFRISAKGRAASELRCIAQARPIAGEPSRVTVCVTDEYGNPAGDFRGIVELSCNADAGLPERYEFTEEDAGSHEFEGRFPTGIVSRVTASSGDMSARSNPILARDEGEPAIYFGDIHCHCEISGDGVGDPDLGYEYARDHWGLDFAAFSDHSPRGERWERAMDVANRHNDAGEFVTFVAFEWSDSVHGHRNAYYRGDDGPEQPRGLSSNMGPWWAFYDERDVDVLTVPHHPNTQSAAKRANGEPVWGPMDWSAINHEYQRIVEICQNRGSFEVPGPNKALRVVRDDCGSSVQTALAKGHRLGFIGSTDTHSGRPGTGIARVAIISDELSREAMWDAMYDRRCYATSGEHILLFFALNGEPMGSEIVLDEGNEARRIEWRVVGTGPVERVDLLRNNEVVESWDGEGREDLSGAFEADTELEGTEWWYLRAIQEDTHMAWSSPIWVDAGE